MFKEKTKVNQETEKEKVEMKQEAEIAIYIWDKLARLEYSTTEDIFFNILDFLTFFEQPGVQRLLSHPDFTGYFHRLFEMHADLLYQMGLVKFCVVMQWSHEPINELIGLYQYIASMQETLPLKEQSDLCFSASLNGSVLAFEKWLNLEIDFLRESNDPKMIPEAILLENIASKLGTPGYILAANFYKKIIIHILEHEPKNSYKLISPLMRNTVEFLVKAEMRRTASGKFISNLYGKTNFQLVIDNPDSPLNGEEDIPTYTNKLVQVYENKTGNTIDIDRICQDAIETCQPLPSSLGSIHKIHEPMTQEKIEILLEGLPKYHYFQLSNLPYRFSSFFNFDPHFGMEENDSDVWLEFEEESDFDKKDDSSSSVSHENISSVQLSKSLTGTINGYVNENEVSDSFTRNPSNEIKICF